MLEKITEINAKFLSLIAWCDGDVDQKELSRFNQIIDSCPGSDAFLVKMKDVIKKKPNKNDCLKNLSMLPKEFSLGILKNAYVVALSNKKFDKKERNLITEAAISIGLAPDKENKFFEMLDHYWKQYQIQNKLFRM